MFKSLNRVCKQTEQDNGCHENTAKETQSLTKRVRTPCRRLAGPFHAPHLYMYAWILKRRKVNSWLFQFLTKFRFLFPRRLTESFSKTGTWITWRLSWVLKKMDLLTWQGSDQVKRFFVRQLHLKVVGLMFSSPGLQFYWWFFALALHFKCRHTNRKRVLAPIRRHFLYWKSWRENYIYIYHARRGQLTCWALRIEWPFSSYCISYYILNATFSLSKGDVILEADGKNVEEEEHKAIVTMIHSASESIRCVAWKTPQTKIWMGVEWKGHRIEVGSRKFNRVEDRTKLWNSL